MFVVVRTVSSNHYYETNITHVYGIFQDEASAAEIATGINDQDDAEAHACVDDDGREWCVMAKVFPVTHDVMTQEDQEAAADADYEACCREAIGEYFNCLQGHTLLIKDGESQPREHLITEGEFTLNFTCPECSGAVYSNTANFIFTCTE